MQLEQGDDKLRMLIVGAFPRKPIREHGGILTSCRALLRSSLPDRMQLILVDSFSAVLPPPFFHRFVRASLRIVLTTFRLLVSRPDVALLFASPGSSFIEKATIALIAKLLGVKTLIFPRGAGLITDYDSSRIYALLLRLCFRIPTLILCQGSVYHDFFVHRIGLHPDKCPVLCNWTATNELLRIGATRNGSSSVSPLQILYLGWVDKKKGIFELLECARRLSSTSEVPSFNVVICGDGSEMAEAQDYINNWDLSGIVKLLGWITDDEKADRLRSSHLLVLPSYMEGMPNAVIEAMAAGLPVVVTDVGAVRDIVSDDINGIVVPPQDSDRLYTAVRRLLLDSALRDCMGQAGWRIAKDKFNVEHMVEELVDLSKEACHRKN